MLGAPLRVQALVGLPLARRSLFGAELSCANVVASAGLGAEGVVVSLPYSELKAAIAPWGDDPRGNTLCPSVEGQSGQEAGGDWQRAPKGSTGPGRAPSTSRLNPATQEPCRAHGEPACGLEPLPTVPGGHTSPAQCPG